jgi:aspartyl-tRNA(Asn)/glutamyl-tRNA(Gln) amidotransferase subunit C
MTPQKNPVKMLEGKQELHMTIDRDTIEKIARLARLSLQGPEIEMYQQQLSRVVDAFTALAKVNTEAVEPMVTPLNERGQLRSDQVEAFSRMDEVVAGAPAVVGRLFKVPPVV